MSRTTIIRRRPATATPFIPSSFFAGSGFPLFARSADELGAQANEMLRAAFGDLAEPAVDRFPALNVSEAKDEFTVTAELPGMAANDVNIEFCDGVLTIQGEKEQEQMKEEDGRKYYIWERRFGSFQRALPFPGGIAEDKIAAEFKDGILTVHIPKAEEAKTKSRPISIATK
jgi:HSP20 family molecular chaperone IbpA